MKPNDALTTIVSKKSFRGTVLSYVISDPGNETINTITDDLNNDGDRAKVHRSVLCAVTNLSQRGLITFGAGTKKSNQPLHPIVNVADCMV
jgi:hypothetical protein